MYRAQRLTLTRWIWMSLWLLATLCLTTLPTAAEVRQSNGHIVMEESDYRFFITKIETLQAENATLKDALANERASFDVYMATVQKERKLRSEERKLLEESISQKMAALRRQRYIPSLIFGGGVGTDGNGAQAFIGLGWKVGF